ncbi:MAG: hypothetical protein RLZZ272_682 [Actinomycetota bacterium]|jgi:tyrosyl-tRNA synthetase
MSPSASVSDPLDDPLALLRGRGFVQDVTDGAALAARFREGRVTYYVGFDPTAPSLHVGNLMGIMAMAWLQRAGHRPIALAGGATGRIGDPSGRDSERELLDEERITANLVGIRRQLGSILDLSTPEAGLLLDNHDWLGRFSFLGFLREVGVHASVNQMVAREAVKRRLEAREQGLTFTEFTYQLLQAYDFAHLAAEHGCVLQGGGSDQWGNITAGIELTRKLHGIQVFGVVWPLLTTEDGEKLGKSAGNSVWLDPERTSPYAYYQYWLNRADAELERLLLAFTFLPRAEVTELAAAHASDPGAREGQRVLAREATRILHGDEGVAAAERATDVLFGDAPFAGVSDAALADAFGEAPSKELARGRLDEGLGLLELLVELGAARSNGEARRLVEQGGVRVNNAAVDDASRRLGPDDLAGATTLVVSVGRKRHHLARFV